MDWWNARLDKKQVEVEQALANVGIKVIKWVNREPIIEPYDREKLYGVVKRVQQIVNEDQVSKTAPTTGTAPAPPPKVKNKKKRGR